MEKEYLIGANYYCGWYRNEPNRWATDGVDWRLTYPERIPLLGCYNDQGTMDAEIDAAHRYGVDFFMMLWYYDKTKVFPFADQTNKCIPMFRASANKHLAQFMIEYCNHPPFFIKSDAEWRRKANYFVECMKDTSYLRVGGKCQFKFHSIYYFMQEVGGNMTRAAARIAYLRDCAKEQGVGELCISAGIMNDGIAEQDREAMYLFDYFATYGDIPNVLPRKEDYPYATLEAHAIAGRKRIAKEGAYFYMPFIQSGWNPKPWKDPRPSFRLPTKTQWRHTLREMKRALDNAENLGIPTEHGVQKAFNIYAWNEYGEGGMLAPTLGDGYGKLEGIREVFGNAQDSE